MTPYHLVLQYYQLCREALRVTSESPILLATAPKFTIHPIIESRLRFIRKWQRPIRPYPILTFLGRIFMRHSVSAYYPYGWTATRTYPFLIRLSLVVITSFAFLGVDSFLRLFAFDPFLVFAFLRYFAAFIVIFVDLFGTSLATEKL
jgi:hypothetical protein